MFIFATSSSHPVIDFKKSFQLSKRSIITSALFSLVAILDANESDCSDTLECREPAAGVLEAFNMDPLLPNFLGLGIPLDDCSGVDKEGDG
ncbi:hypothetical protein G6F57_023782 [Rhizopus arrhizus]|nr:hypothetical protein G6F57_023782 [Rhizopus arrhizus]